MYTNGFDSIKVLTALKGRLGWSDSTLSPAILESRSGRKYDDGSFHALVTVDNVKTSADPIPGDWNAYFDAKQKAVIQRCLTGVFNVPENLEQVTLYSAETEQEFEVSNAGMFAGFRIEVSNRKDISVAVNSIELYFNEAATFNIYLFKQGSKAPVKTKEVTTEAGTKTMVDLSDWILNCKQAPVFYIGYFQADLGTAKAIQEVNVCWDRTLCFSAAPILSNVIGENQFDRVTFAYGMQPYGLNLFLSSFRDFTDAIVRQSHLFDELQGLCMAYVVMEQIAYSKRANKDERTNKEAVAPGVIQYELQGAIPVENTPKITGLRQRIDRETKRVQESFFPKPKAMTVSLC